MGSSACGRRAVHPTYLGANGVTPGQVARKPFIVVFNEAREGVVVEDGRILDRGLQMVDQVVDDLELFASAVLAGETPKEGLDQVVHEARRTPGASAGSRLVISSCQPLPRISSSAASRRRVFSSS